MMRRAHVLPLLLLPPLLLTACGTEGPAGDPVAAAASAEASAAAEKDIVTPNELENRAEALGIAPELVYVTRTPDLTLAQQSVGVVGDDGFSASYVVDASGAAVRLAVDRGSMTEDTCRELPVGDMSGERTGCEPDAGMLYRTGGGRHEYALPKNGFVIRLTADADAVPRAVLREAADSVHRPDAAEAAATLPSPRPAATAPVERGDLPPVGDGAPDNSVGLGG
ncbi:hypothetical protein [Streptomyces sp. SID5910]|uniref:hypothetical protein n=1 Tax=Streptomyces sp. SID5910 TaxID=2690312 RepID=UPI0013700E6E|nr:hypothetical protein [Streptomyces sp. SID5910]MYR42185.1 hypothetical protein [Streptomyces sp. SID5910]